jgi:hypothetical protein
VSDPAEEAADRRVEARRTTLRGLQERESCESCRFSVKRNGLLFCRRYPPTVVPPLASGVAPEQMVVSVQPETERADWCGEYQEQRP